MLIQLDFSVKVQQCYCINVKFQLDAGSKSQCWQQGYKQNQHNAQPHRTPKYIQIQNHIACFLTY